MNKTTSLRKSKKTYLHILHLFRKKKKNLAEGPKLALYSKLQEVEAALIKKDRELAGNLCKELQSLAQIHLRKNAFQQLCDLVFALGFALVIAIIVRMMWFEFYEIPTGSMRPTLKEQDRLAVSKTTFGINVPLTTKHFYFDPELVQRSDIFIFTGENMDIHDVDTLYFYIFPGKKQLVKRMMGKPGDKLYFYGGLIYGVDSTGKDITAELQPPRLDKIDHIPFISFEGKTTVPRAPLQGIFSPVIINQMNEPVARLSLSTVNQLRGELLAPFQSMGEYYNIWGFKNYAMARVISRGDNASLGSSPYYLEIKHHPTLNNLQVLRDEMGRLRPALGYSTSFIPLSTENLQTLFKNLYTARFFVKNGKAYRFGMPASYIQNNPYLPTLAGVPDGCYEFYYGKGYEVKWQGITQELPATHPLMQFSPERAQLLFNVGIEFDMNYMPQLKNQRLFPSRYAYFRSGDFYVMGAPLFKKDDPALMAFVAAESKTATPFVDSGPPLKADGTLDTLVIHKYGMKIPEKGYLGLGDNHAMSADSRDFGFIPQSNLRGAPDFIFWPPGSRWGHPNQPPYPWINAPRLIVWLLAAITLSVWWLLHRKRTTLPLLTKTDSEP